MQNYQTNAFWFELAKILIPSLTALIVPFVAGWLVARKLENHKKEISKELEDYKKDISKEIESYKSQLQAQNYEFQTRFSLFHEREAEAVLNLYESIAEIHSKFALMRTFFRNSTFAPIEAKSRLILTGKTIAEHFAETELKCLEFNQIFRKNRILLDEETCEKCLEIINLLVNSMNRFEDLLKNDNQNLKLQNSDTLQIETWLENLSNSEKLLREKFRTLLSAENPRRELNKKD
ncbi:MAG TPA: hypothetical protein PKY59_04530 [Pyrinomonadaceae bacterium]|nr:hypothetical protein [Pyrinomonadaceae bacterium]